MAKSKPNELYDGVIKSMTDKDRAKAKAEVAKTQKSDPKRTDGRITGKEGKPPKPKDPRGTW